MKLYLRVFVLVLCIYLTGCMARHCAEPVQYKADIPVLRDSIRAHINIAGSMYANNGFPLGFQYTMLSAMADSLGVSLEIAGAGMDPDCWDSLGKGVYDIVVKKDTDTIPAEYDGVFVCSMPYRDYEMVLRKDDEVMIRNVNGWIGYMHSSPLYARIQDNFFRSYDLTPFIMTGHLSRRISPYDAIVKNQARRLGWDWRLLSAVIFKESRFSMGVASKRGATGLMQVLKSTAATYGVYDLYNPEENVKAGTSYLSYLKNRYEKMGIDSLNVIKFTLAAYNAGESRINDCMNFTMSLGRNFADWEEVAATIPLMSDPEYYGDADFLRHGKFYGTETVEYVNKVMDIYSLYCQVVRY